MILAAIVSLIAGLTIGLSINLLARIKDFHFFNTWFVLLVLMLFVLPVFTGFVLIEDLVQLLKEIPKRTIKGIVIPSLFGGVSLFLLSNSIRKIPADLALVFYFVGFQISYILFGNQELNWIETAGIFSLGMLWLVFRQGKIEFDLKSISLPLIGGLVSIGFVFAYRVEPQMLSELALSFGNDYRQVEMLKIVLITVASSVFVLPIFLAQAGQKNAWVYFDTPLLGKNLLKITGLAILLVACVFVYFVLKPYSTVTMLPFIGAIIVGLYIKLP